VWIPTSGSTRTPWSGVAGYNQVTDAVTSITAARESGQASWKF